MTPLLRPGRLVAAVLISACAAGCDFGKVAAPTAPDQSNVPYSQTDFTIGTGATAVPGSTVTVNYGAWLYDDTAPDKKGVQLDANTTTFVIGANQVIPGFEQAVTGMNVGGTRRAIIPPSLAYGSTGSNGAITIPPNAALVFDLALTAVTPPQ
ncbi:MAG TPA: FKBP-type peptidyl-prolyl cis-trans isomerase [Vicinamibacterales bacterium]|jgi:FKBP-type peptidyl-prolyl cis-trans isomerase FkpA